MPLPIVHLGVANALLDKLNIRDIPAFYLGSISPDAVHMRDGSTREDKNRSHLRGSNQEIWKNNAKDFLSGAHCDFTVGYGLHVLTDMRWGDTIYSAFKSRYAADDAPIQEERAAYYNDTDQLDFSLYFRYAQRAEIWDHLQASAAIGIEGLVSADEVAAWNHRTLHWFDKGKSEHTNPIRYITYDDILAFIKDTAAALYEDMR